jgi:DNA-binding NtrC family response regulator
MEDADVMHDLLPLDQKILVVEDDPTMARTTVRVLDDDGRVFHVCEDVASAKAALDREPWDVILSDYQLPDGPGSIVLAHARDRRPDAPRLLVTSHNDWFTASSAVNAGEVFRIVAKPWSDDVLRSVVEQALDLKRVRDEHRELKELARRQQRELAEANASLVAKSMLLERESDEHLRRIVASLAEAVEQGVGRGSFDPLAFQRAVALDLELSREELVAKAGPKLLELSRLLERIVAARGGVHVRV